MSTEHENAIYTFLSQRRSASILVEPKPGASELEKILAVAGTVPDHGSLRPYRFVVIQNEARDTFGEALLNAADEHRSQPLDPAVRPKIKAKAFAAPLQVLIVYSPVPSEKIPDWEQMASASCTGYALILAANALGFGAVWKSFAYAPGSQLRTLCTLSEGEKILGWVNIGTEKNLERSGRIPFPVTQHASILG